VVPGRAVLASKTLSYPDETDKEDMVIVRDGPFVAIDQAGISLLRLSDKDAVSHVMRQELMRLTGTMLHI